MSDSERRGVPWFLWPFKALWDLITWILVATGRLVAAILGLVFMIVGVILTVTVIGAFIGIPFIIFGFALMVRSIF